MKTERLKKAVEELRIIVEEMQAEVNEFQSKKSSWYEEHLMLLRSGILTTEQFDRCIWDEVTKMYTSTFEGAIGALQLSLLGIDHSYESFIGQEEHLARVINRKIFHKPWDWKVWRICYRDSSCSSLQIENFYGPDEKYAANRCIEHNSLGDNKITIIEVKEISDEELREM